VALVVHARLALWLVGREVPVQAVREGSNMDGCYMTSFILGWAAVIVIVFGFSYYKNWRKSQ
jgi:hypothetical protein